MDCKNIKYKSKCENQFHQKRKCAILLKQLHNSMHKNFNKDLESLNLTMAQGEILFYLFRNQEKKIKQKDIEIALKISNPTATGTLKRMEEKELLSRTADEKDARSKIVLLTQKALDIKEELATRREIASEKLFLNFKEDEIAEFERCLIVMIQNMGEEEVE